MIKGRPHGEALLLVTPTFTADSVARGIPFGAIRFRFRCVDLSPRGNILGKVEPLKFDMA